MDEEQDIFQIIDSSCLGIIQTSLEFPTIENTDHSPIDTFLDNYKRLEWTRNQLTDYKREYNQLTTQNNIEKSDLDASIQQARDQILKDTEEVKLLELIDTTLIKSYLLNTVHNETLSTPLLESIHVLLQRKQKLDGLLRDRNKEINKILSKQNALLKENIQLQKDNLDYMNQINKIRNSQYDEENSQNTNQRKSTLLNKLKKYQKENTILRNILLNIITISHINWSKDPELCELMLALDEQPGIPEKDLFKSQSSQEPSNEQSSQQSISSSINLSANLVPSQQY